MAKQKCKDEDHGIWEYSDKQLQDELNRRAEAAEKAAAKEWERRSNRKVRIEINRCAYCPHVHKETPGSYYTDYYCAHRDHGQATTHRAIVRYAESEGEILIPDWCPLLKENNDE